MILNEDRGQLRRSSGKGKLRVKGTKS